MPVIPGRRRRSRRSEMSLIEHLNELRRALVISMITIAVLAVTGFVFYDRIIEFLAGPYQQAIQSLPPGSRPPGSLGRGLITLSPTEPFVTFLKVGFFVGFLLALPVVLWQLWRFITPGLTKRERRFAVPFVASSVVLFAGGTLLAFYVVPKGLGFLLSFGGENVTTLLTAERYLNFLIFLILGFGLSFEFPLLLIFLASARIVTSRQMWGWRRYVYFGSLVFAAIITPTQDPYTLLLMWVPLIVLYEGSVLVARLMKR
ncbi:MAG: twin-arginine translocase subunit TatC [Actinomycetota bacterium]